MLWLIDVFFPLENLYSCGEFSNTGKDFRFEQSYRSKQLWHDKDPPPRPLRSKAVATGKEPKFATFNDIV